jgi:hypothetical protein
MEQVIKQCLYSLIALADDCEDEGEPDRARLLRTCARLLEDEIERYRTAIQQTLDDNGHLADGEDCTLIHLVRVIADLTPNAQVQGRAGSLARPAGMTC